MIGERMLQIVKELSLARCNAAEYQRQLDLSQTVLRECEAELTLRVSGKNAEERKAQLVMAMQSDPTAIRCHTDIYEYTDRLSRERIRVEALSDERRAMEWIIRMRTAERLGAEFSDVQLDQAADDGLADLPF